MVLSACFSCNLIATGSTRGNSRKAGDTDRTPVSQGTWRVSGFVREDAFRTGVAAVSPVSS